ncbi:uncharacterized protein PG998_004292 [Apiospora kogelbergensis]|uniref:uncharacterized protein n=1 Tax=Apiospora kogelbergensis TaxID=1337665 RepID=UPI003130DC36
MEPRPNRTIAGNFDVPVGQETVTGKTKYRYWATLDFQVLQYLEKDCQDSIKPPSLEDRQIRVNSETLFGVALTLMIQKTRTPNYHHKVRQYVESAACKEPASLAAQGVVAQICDATADVEGIDQLALWQTALTKAIESGSTVAATKLRELDPELAFKAKATHRSRGGYNEDRHLAFKSESAPQPVGAFQAMSLVGTASTIYHQGADAKNTRLHLAAITGRVDDMETAIRTCATQVNQKNSKGETALYKACLSGNFDIVRIITTRGGADASLTAGEHEISCLHWLFQFDDSHIPSTLDLLIQHGADVSARTKAGSTKGDRNWIPATHFPFHWPHGTPLHWASHVGSITAAKALLQAHANIDASDCPGDIRSLTPLGLALNNADSKMVRFLCDNKANPNRVDERNYKPLHILVLPEGNRNYLLDRSFHRWCTHGSAANNLREVKACVTALRDAGAWLDDQRLSSTPLIQAARAGDAASVIALIEAGANPNLIDAFDRRSPLLIWVTIDPAWTAYTETYYQALELLLDTANILTTDRAGDSVIHLAVTNPGGPEVVGEILSAVRKRSEHTVDINAVNHRQITPLLMAIQNIADHGEFAWGLTGLLFELGADRWARDCEGCDFIWYIARNHSIGDKRCLDLMKIHLEHKDAADPREILNRSRNHKSGSTALMELASNSYEECIKYCLRLRVDTTPESNDGKTVLDIAFRKGNAIRMNLLENLTNQGIRGLSDEEIREGWWKQLIEPSDIEVYPTQKYDSAPRILKLLVDAGARPGHCDYIMSSKYQDATFAKFYKARDWYVAEEQPFYGRWKILYELDDNYASTDPYDTDSDG